MKYWVTLFIIIILLSCGNSNDEPQVQENRNPGSFTTSIADISQTSATLNWTTSVDPDDDIVVYDIMLNGISKVTSLNKTTYVLNDLDDDTQYDGEVIAKDNFGGRTTSNFNFKTLEENNQTIDFNIPNNLTNYYSTMTFYENSELLKDELSTHIISKHTTFLAYTERHNYLYDADEDFNNTANVILIYSGESRDEREYISGLNTYPTQTFNTEHVYPQSLIGNTAKGDLHHLRVCDEDINSSRSNHPFTESTGSYALVNGNSWYPGDEWKGDVARMIFYLNLRYNENFDDVGNLALFLKWSKEDPVSSFEEQRNNVIENAQGNRNPFIDNPYLATLIWGGEGAENTWQ